MEQKNIRLISRVDEFPLKPSDGSRLICNSKDIFNAGINKNFVTWGLNNPGIATSGTFMQVHEMVSHGTSMDIFTGLPGTWNQKWLSQNQFIDFCETYPSWLRQGRRGRFALIKKDENKLIDEASPWNNSFVVFVRRRSSGRRSSVLRVDVHLLKDRHTWSGGAHRLVVSPQIIPLV